MNDLSDFLRGKESEEEKNRTNFEKTKQDWIKEIGKLYDQFKTWLSDAKNNGLIEIKDNLSLKLAEQNIGTYEVPVLQVKSKKSVNEFSIEPVGRLIIGAKARIDIRQFGASRYMIIFDGNRWLITDWSEHNIAKYYRGLDEKTFIEAIKSLL
jgi:hypothetical protein